jgi:hypothetical protein
LALLGDGGGCDIITAVVVVTPVSTQKSEWHYAGQPVETNRIEKVSTIYCTNFNNTILLHPPSIFVTSKPHEIISPK